MNCRFRSSSWELKMNSERPRFVKGAHKIAIFKLVSNLEAEIVGRID
jgi:hypothetical protein